MLRRLVFVLCLIATGTSETNAGSPKLPAAPTGFQWIWSPEMGGGFLCPDGWHAKKEKKADTEALFITKENIDTEGKFTTGLTVNVISRIRRKTGLPPSRYMPRLLAENAQGKKVLLELPPKKSGRITGHVLRLQDDVLVVHHSLLADDQTDKLYVVSFESPVGEWESNKKYWEPMLGKMAWEFPK